MVFTECHVLDTGYCLTPACALLQGAGLRIVRCHCLVALLRHPVEGWGLWDTGYAPRLMEETRRLPYRLYRWATPLPAQPDCSVVSQLAGKGLTARDIRWIVLSHLHGDHAAGLRDFPEARIITSQAGYDYAAVRNGFAAVRKAYVPALFPDDFAARACLLPAFDGPELDGLGPSRDLFGDGSAQLFALPGHARGQIGMLAATRQGRMLFVADSILHRASARDGRPPGLLTRIIADAPAQIVPTVRRLQAFTRLHPDVRVLPTHCPEAYREVIG